MGGLVVKKAYILGHQEPEFLSVVDRVCSIIFLATPHQGSALAQTLSRLIALVPGARPFVDDLMPQSGILQAINEEFPRFCNKLQLMSFYETRTMTLGVNKFLIVEKAAAVMNHPNERRTLLDADHRNVAMFGSPDDSPYVAVRNALATVIGLQRDCSRSQVKRIAQEDQVALNRFLGISAAPEDDIMTHDSARLPGTCEWLANKDYFKSWRQTLGSRFLWLRGKPGTGKSVLAGHIINDLRECAMDCCFFFFQAGDNTKSTASVCLRSLAWQMATLHPNVFAKVVELLAESKDDPIDKTDHIPVWRRVYLPGILKARLNRTQFWVIDAMDECKGSSDLMGYLSRIQEQWPVSIIVTSRDPVEAHLSSGNSRVDIRADVISDEDSKQDISLFLKSNISLIPCPSTSKWSSPWDMASHIIQNSGGCFLWASLICSELREAYTEKEIEQVLDSIPSNMNSLYSKILGNMAQARFGKELARAILTWTTYSFRALTTTEIKEPIEMDINDKIDDIERSISKCCGNFVYVDTHAKVQLVHLTAREFFTRKDFESEFIYPKAEAHHRMATVCLQYLIQSKANTQKIRRHGSELDVIPAHSSTPPFIAYASTYVFQHLNLVHSNEDEIFVVLSKFLGSTSVLRWIEFIASTGDLQPVYRAGKTINHLLARRAQLSPPMRFGQKNMALLEKWGDDLIHLATKFSSRLRLAPHSIHRLIPPFCPLSSAIRQQFVNPYRGITVQGLSARGWDDCLATITYLKGTRPNVVGAGPGFFAVGMMNGSVMVYDDSVLQEVHTLHHQEPVWRMAFSASGKYLASAGAKMVRIWSTYQGKQLMNFSIPSLCLAIVFGDGDTLLRVATKQNELFEWDMDSQGLAHEPIKWTADLEEAFQFRTPTMAALGTATPLLAVIYRGEDMVLWDYSEERIHDVYEQETGSKMYESIKIAGSPSTVRAVTFGEGIDTNRLAATYTDGILVIYDTLDGSPVATAPDANTMLLASTPDGRTLAGADSRGNLTLFDFETLSPLYRVQFDTAIIPKGLAFASDNRRFIEIRGEQCRVWEPTVLLRQDEPDEENSDTVSLSTGLQEISYQRSQQVNITAIACCKTVSVVFCAKDDGSVHAYDIAGEPESQQLFVQTAGCPISLLYLEENPFVLACGDHSGCVTVRNIGRRGAPRRATTWEVEQPLVDARSPSQGMLKQVLISGNLGRLFVVTEEFDTLWPMPKQAEGNWIARVEGHSRPSWVSHPSNSELLIRATPQEFDIYKWSTLELVRSVRTHFHGEIDRVMSLQHPRIFATICKEAPSTLGTLGYMSIQLWDCNHLENDTLPINPEKEIDGRSSKVERVIGAFGPRMVVYTDDYWVASIEMETSTEDLLVKHFFVPNDWISVVNKFIIGVGRGGEILFAKQSELAVIKRGLEVLGTGGSFNPRTGSARPGKHLSLRQSDSRDTSPRTHGSSFSSR
jgi:WD40 repeat protein